MDDWLVSVEKDGKVVELYFSDELEDMGTIRALHSGCEVNAMRMDSGKSGQRKGEPAKRQNYRNRRIRCVETGEVFDSASECGKAFNVARTNIYKAVQRGITAGGYHFEYE